MVEQLDLTFQTYDPAVLAEMALSDDALMHELLDGVSPEPKPEARRGNCSKALLHLAKTCPDVLLPHWRYFADLMRSDNGYSIYVAVYVIAALAEIEKQGLFKDTCHDFLALLADKRGMVAAHAVLNAGRIALARPDFRGDIITSLLDIESIQKGKNRGLVSAYVIEALDTLYDTVNNKDEILAFVKEQVESSSPKTRKLAKAFLNKRQV